MGEKIDPHTALDVSTGDYDDVTSDSYQADINSLHDAFEQAGIDSLEFTLMRKAIADPTNGLLAGLAIWGTAQALGILKAWLPAREGRKLRIRFKDGSEIEATTIHELESLRDKFLTHIPDCSADQQ